MDRQMMSWAPVLILCHAIHYACAGLYTAALCRAGTTATAGSITIVPVGGSVRFPLLHHSQEKFEMVMGRVHPDLAILAWKSSSPEYPYMVSSSYIDRARFRRDAFIELRAVGPGDQVTYEMEKSYYGSELRNRDRFELRVVEPMSTPTVEVSCNSSHLTLNCSTVSGCPVTYRWARRSEDPGVGNATFPGAVLYLPDPGRHNCTYTCIAEDCCSSHAVTATLHCDALSGGSRSRWGLVLFMLLLAVIQLAVAVMGIEFRQKPCRTRSGTVCNRESCRVPTAVRGGLRAPGPWVIGNGFAAVPSLWQM